MTVIEHKKCICVEFGDTNNNKVWQYTKFDNGEVLTEWGRVGKSLQSKLTTESQALKKWREKTNPNNKPDKRYTEVKAIDCSSSAPSIKIGSSQLKEIAKKQIKFNSPIVQKFIEFLTDVNAHNILQSTGGSIAYNVESGQFQTPMGIIVPDQVANARNILFELAKLVKNNKYGDVQFGKKLNQYLRLIPHDVGMKKIDPYEILPDMVSVQKENDILDGLEASFNTITTNVKKDKTTNKEADEPVVFNTELHIVDNGKVIDRINKNYEKTKRGNHSCSHLKLKKVYSVIIKSSKDRFDNVAQKIGNIHEFYHGTSSQNLLSILKNGFKVTPPSSAYITGKMFGNGTYTAPGSSKALNYSYGYWSGTRNNRCFMFLVDVICGKVYTPRSYNESFPKPGYDSTWAKANISGVMNDEVIVYKDDRCNPTYLLEFS